LGSEGEHDEGEEFPEAECGSDILTEQPEGRVGVGMRDHDLAANLGAIKLRLMRHLDRENKNANKINRKMQMARARRREEEEGRLKALQRVVHLICEGVASYT
jgi:hypothetical protein